MQTDAFQFSKVFLLSFFFIALVNLFINNHLSLWDQDESAYAGFALNIIESGNWAIPDFIWSEVHRKTPFHFWSIAVSYKVFGVNEFAVRFPGALAIVLTWLMVYFWGRSVFGEQAALLGTCFLAASMFLPNLGKISVTDAVLLFWQSMCVLALINFMEKPTFKWLLLFWLGVAGGVMTKGPPVLILAGGMSLILLLFHPNRLRLFRLHPWIFLPLSLLPLYLWGRAAWQYDDGAFVMWMVDWYILERARGGTAFGQTGPPGYFLILFCLSALPFLALFLHALKVLFKETVLNWFRNKDYLYFFAWFLPAWFFYEFIPSKLPSYALAALPGISLLMGVLISQHSLKETLSKTSVKWISGFGLFVALALTVALPIAIFDLTGELNSMFILMTVAFIFWFALMVYQYVLLTKKAFDNWLKLGLINGLMFILMGWLFAVPLLEEQRSATKQIAEKAAELSENTLFYMSIGYPQPSLPFYLQVNGFAFKDVKYADHAALAKKPNDTNIAWIITSEIKQAWSEQEWFNEMLPQVKIQSVSAWISDRGRHDTYYLLSYTQ